jgi:hypothetical protein
MVPDQNNPLIQAIYAASNKYGVNPQFAMNIFHQESGINPNVRDSSAGAIGIGQLMPDTARNLGVDPRDPYQNIDGSVRYMRQMQDQFGTPALTAAAYNAGPGRVRQYLNGRGLPLETQNYIKSVTGQAYTQPSTMRPGDEPMPGNPQGSGPMEDEMGGTMSPQLMAAMAQLRNSAVPQSAPQGNPMSGTLQSLGIPQPGQGPISGLMSRMFPGAAAAVGGPSFGNRLQQAAAWALAANNPGAAAQMLGAVNNGSYNNLKAASLLAPKFGQTGVDILGHQTYGMQPNGLAAMLGVGSNMMAGAPGPTGMGGVGAGNPMSGSAPMQSLLQVKQAYDQGGSDAALKQVPEFLQDYVRDYASGNLNPTDIRDPGMRSYVQMLVHSVYPGTTDNQFRARGQFATELNKHEPTALGGQIDSANGMIEHAGEYMALLQQLNQQPFGERPTDFGSAIPGFESLNGRLQKMANSPSNSLWAGIMQAARGLVGEYEKFMSNGRSSSEIRQEQLDQLDPRVVGPTQAETNARTMVSQLIKKAGGIAATRNMGYSDNINVPQSATALNADGTKNLLTYQGKITAQDLFGRQQQDVIDKVFGGFSTSPEKLPAGVNSIKVIGQ